MKIFFLFLLTVSLAFSNDKKIILGSYLQEINSSRALDKVQKIIQKDEVLQKLIKINHLSVQIEKLGQYHVISLKTVTNYVQLLRTMKAFRKYYTDLYALPPYQSATPKLKTVKHIIEKVEKKPQKVIQKTVVKKKATLLEKKVLKEKEPETFNEDDLLIEDELTETYDEDNLINYQIAITIIIAIILLLILINTIIKLRRSSQKEKFTPFKEK